jgi:Xaa-Pro aminopeptidase
VTRIVELQKSLETKPFDAWLIEDPLDLYYLTGESFSVGQLWITSNEVLLLVDGRYIEKAKQTLKIPVVLKTWDRVSELIVKNKVKKVAFDAEKTVFSQVELLKRKIGDSISFEPVSLITNELRKQKDKSELQKIKKSAEILWEGYLYIKTLLKEGVVEKEVAKKFEIFCLQKGAEGLSFEPIIAFGENSALPHHRAGARVLQKGDIVLIDIGVVFNRYASDMTRVVFFGKPDPILAKWLDIVIEAEQSAIEMCKADTVIKELDVRARSVFKRYDLEEYFVHSLGHGVGLEVHEPPRIRYDNEAGVLKPGMVITIEPGLYLPGKGGVRYEDMIVITETGCENLFPFDKAFL